MKFGIKNHSVVVYLFEIRTCRHSRAKFFTVFDDDWAPSSEKREVSHSLKYKKHVKWGSHIASSPILQSYFFKEVCYLGLNSSQRKPRGCIKFLTFDVTIKKNLIQIS